MIACNCVGRPNGRLCTTLSNHSVKSILGAIHALQTEAMNR